MKQVELKNDVQNKNLNHKKVVIYCRTARRDKPAISRQIMTLKEYAAKQAMKVAGVYVDDGVSGLTLERPGLNQLRAAVKKGGLDVVLTLHPDRLSRDVLGSAELRKEFKQYGVELLFRNLPSQSPADALMVALIEGFGENQQQFSENIRRGLRWKKSLRCPHCHERIFKK